MSAGKSSRFPPGRLPGISDKHWTWVRPLWFVALALAILFDVFGTAYILNDVYKRDPVYAAFGLSSQIENDGSASVASLITDKAGRYAIPEGTKIVAIDGRPVPPAMRIGDITDLLAAVPGPTASFDMRDAEGKLTRRSLTRSNQYVAEVNAKAVLTLDQRMVIRFVISLSTCCVLIGCAVLLFMRRPRDPVALLLSLSFLLFAATIDPPLNMWLGFGWGDVFDFYSALAWLLLVIGIAVFPDGKFEPRWLRWMLVFAPFAAVTLMIDEVPILVGTLIAFIAPLALLTSQFIRYHRLDEGIERQQIKWAAFGFASGLIMVSIAFVLVILDLASGSRWSPVYGLGVLTFFSLGFMAMALGLLISLTRFRLWEADRVISRSAVYAIVTVIVGIVWAASADIVKNLVDLILGEENKAVATTAGAVLAAGLFAPTQALALRWTKRRFGKDRERIRALISRLNGWRVTETPAEIGMRTLSALAVATHASAGAILVDTPMGRELVAARDVENPEDLALPGAQHEEDERFTLALPLEDEDGQVGVLLVGPRSDLNRYNKDEQKGFNEVLEPLAEALRAALKRTQHVDTVKQLIGSVEARLARLEGSGGAPHPA